MRLILKLRKFLIKIMKVINNKRLQAVIFEKGEETLEKLMRNNTRSMEKQINAREIEGKKGIIPIIGE